MNLLQKNFIFNLCTMTYLKSLYDDAQADKGALKNPYEFTGQRFDEEVDLNYFKNRYYSASLGRFISRDPVGYSDGMGLYNYVGNMVTMAVDPRGYSKEKNGRGSGDEFRDWTGEEIDDRLKELRKKNENDGKIIKGNKLPWSLPILLFPIQLGAGVLGLGAA